MVNGKYLGGQLPDTGTSCNHVSIFGTAPPFYGNFKTFLLGQNKRNEYGIAL